MQTRTVTRARQPDGTSLNFVCEDRTMSIDFDALKVPTDRKIKVTPILSTITCGKPNKTAFFRIRAGEGWEPIEVYTYSPDRLGKDSMPYLVMPECQKLLDEMELLTPAKFYFYMMFGSNIMKVDFVSQRTDKNGNLSRYHLTRMDAYNAAKTQWVRMHSNQDGGFYSWALAEDILPEPVWAPKPATLQEAIEIAFKGFIIDTLEHPEIKKLRGKL